MKILIVTLALFVTAQSVFAQSAEYTKFVCNLSDLSQSDNPNILTQTFEIEASRPTIVAAYQGMKFDITRFVLTHPRSNQLKYELSLAVRDARSNTLISSSNAVHSVDVPELSLQVGPNIIIRCVGSR